MQTITPALEAILKARLQAGADGFFGRMEIDVLEASEFTCSAAVSTAIVEETTDGEPEGDASISITPDAGEDYLLIGGVCGTVGTGINVTGSFTALYEQDYPISDHPVFASAYQAVSAASGSYDLEATYGSAEGSWGAVVAAIRTSASAPIQDKSTSNTINTTLNLDDPTDPSSLLVMVASSRDDPSIDVGGCQPIGVWTKIAEANARFGLSQDVVAIFVACGQTIGTSEDVGIPGGGHVTFSEWAIEGSSDVFGPFEIKPKRISLDKSLRLAVDQFEVEVANEDLPFGWGPDSVFVTNSRIRIYQGYGEPANEVLTFTGLIDRVRDHRDILTTSITGRSMMALLKDQTFSTIGPQSLGEVNALTALYAQMEGNPANLPDAILTPENGVYQNMEASDVVSDILDRAGWPTADRDITDTSYVLDSYILQDGWSWGEAIDGDERITGMTGYRLWDDEAGVIHFSPLPTDSVTDPVTPAYTFRSGEDITALDDETDQQDLITRVKVRGPLVSYVLKDVWRELWTTRKIKHPTGIWYDPDHTDQIRVLDRQTKRLYRVEEDDGGGGIGALTRIRVLGSVDISGIVAHPQDISGDPDDNDYYWLLNAPWNDGGADTGNRIKKVRKSDHHAVSVIELPDGKWTALQVGSSAIWLTRKDTDKLYRRDKDTGAAVNSWHHSYNGNQQTNPTGLMRDGSDIYIFYRNGGSTARFLKVKTSAPGTVVDVVKTAGTNYYGGEINTTTHIHAYGYSYSQGLVGKFKLFAKDDQPPEVFAEVIDTELEDELGSLAQSEDREHDSHAGDADHPYEIRRLTLDLPAITNLAQAMETGRRKLEELGKRRRVVDVGIIGNPALQKTDLIAEVDPVTGLSQTALIDTYRSDMVADGTYLGTLATIPADVIDDEPEDEGTAEDDDEIVEEEVDETDPEEEPEPPVEGAYYIAPDGDDDTGDGSIGSPWLTIRKFADVAAPGDTLYCRGGTYPDTPRLILADGDVSGTSGNPITVIAYPGEEPEFEGAGSGSYSQFVMVTDGVSYWTFDGLTCSEFKTGSSGVFYVGRNVGLMVATHHIIIRNCTVTMVHEGTGPFNHCVYLSEYAEDCTIEDNRFIGAQVAGSDGTGCNIGDHEPSPQRTLIQRNVFSNFGTAGAIWWNGDLNTGSILHNTFLTPGIRFISLRYYTSVTVRNNAGQTASSVNIDNVNDGGGTATIDHNFFGQTFDVDHTLLPGNTGINAATDGTDAGAIDSGT